MVSGRLDEPAVRQIARMAEDLGADLIGDEGERYALPPSAPAIGSRDTASRTAGRPTRAAVVGPWARLCGTRR
ncbi:hypothetical protein GCM10010182_00560 [Actinomadura cremea]|nr:hypothetical protein GCM10010182_00560 [Actinomadura cremea]